MFFLLEGFPKHKSADDRKDGNSYMCYCLFNKRSQRTLKHTELLGAISKVQWARACWCASCTLICGCSVLGSFGLRLKVLQLLFALLISDLSMCEIPCSVLQTMLLCHGKRRYTGESDIVVRKHSSELDTMIGSQW